jgi:hypothetical protein
MCLKYIHYSRFVCEHNWEGLCNSLERDQAIFTSKAYEFFISALILEQSARLTGGDNSQLDPDGQNIVCAAGSAHNNSTHQVSVICYMHGSNMQCVLVPYK